MLASLAKRFDPYYISGSTVSSDATPAKTTFGTDSTSTSKALDFEQVRIELASEMDGHWVGPMPVDEFFDEFLLPSNGLPDVPDIPEDPFKDVPSKEVETACYTPFISAIEGWMPHLGAVDTSMKEDVVNELRLKTDISVYPRVEGAQIPDRTDFSQMELWIEFQRKTKGVAFEDPKRPELDGKCRSAPGDVPFTPGTRDGIYARGRLTHYAGAVDGKQFRNFSFSVLIEGDDARFLRWDPSGTIVSAAFDYRENPRPMAEFLWRFNHLSSAERGHDTSIGPAELPAKIEGRIRKKLNVDDGIPLYRYSVPGLIGRGYACGPQLPAQDRPVIRRRTRSSPLVWIPVGDVGGRAAGGRSPSKEDGSLAAGQEGATNEPWDEERMIYMKDTWQFLSDLPDVALLPERDVYAILHKHGTPNIPEHVEGGDVDGSRTRTQEFANALWLGVKPRMLARQRYRLVHGVVGRPLVKFDSTKQLVTAVLDALKAHSHAYENAKIMHCDISVGNIILTDGGRGLLIDWEMAEIVDDAGSGRPGRTGTWQFMSAGLLQDPKKVHVFEDDLESFLHVLAWMTLCHVPATDKYPPGFREMDLEMFHEHRWVTGRGELGGSQKRNWFFLRGYPSERFQPRKPTPLLALLETLREPFKSLYCADPPTDEDRRKAEQPLDMSDWKLIRVAVAVHQYDEGMAHLRSSNWFVERMTEALDEQDWPADDGSDDRRREVLENAMGIAGGAKRPASSSPESEPPLKRLRVVSGSRS